MKAYRRKDLERLLRVSPGALRSLMRSAQVVAERGPRGVLLFSFQDLIVLRTVRSLVAANVPSRRIRTSLQSLRSRLPESAPLTGLSISAMGDQIAVREGSSQWEGASGQYLMAFEVLGQGAEVQLIDARLQRSAPAECSARFASALALEETSAEDAIAAYRHCMAQHSENIEAYINGGRLLHAAGRVQEAIEVYRAAPQPDATLLFNLAIALEDGGKEAEALAAYHAALELDDGFADAHFNLARLYEVAGNPLSSLRHFSAYRKLTASRV